MASGEKNSSNDSRSSASSAENEDGDTIYTKEGVMKTIIPESSVPTVGMEVPELKKEMSFWQIGTASVTRVKIDALRPETEIKTEDAGQITGMFSEGYDTISTLGTVIIHIKDKPIKAHVTRSLCAAPIVADGILGFDCLGSYCAGSGKILLRGLRPAFSVFTGKQLIPNYLNLLRRRMIENSVAFARGRWSIVSSQLRKLREFLPSDVADDERLPVIEILEGYVDCFYVPDEALGFTKLLKYTITMKNGHVISIPQNDQSTENWKEIDRQVKNLLDQGIIQISTSPYNSPIKLIEKRADLKRDSHRCLAVDYHTLNKISEGSAFPIPDINDLVDRLHGSKYFSVVDLASASYQIELEPADWEKTAFTTRYGHYEFTRMPMGIKNASQYIQRLLHEVFDDMLYSSNSIFVCNDDILVYASTIEEHEIRVRKVLTRIRNAGLKLQPAKCQLLRNSVYYIGYLITDEGLRPNPTKIQQIRDHPLPDTRVCLSRFVGLLGGFKRFVRNFAERAKPMMTLLKNDNIKVKWTEEAKRSFDDLKETLSKDLLLQYPDWNETFVLETSSSNCAIEATLKQQRSGKSGLVVISHASRFYTAAEMKYCPLNRERLAAMYGMDTWYWYLSNEKKFILKTPNPRAFDWYIRRDYHKSDILMRFEFSFIGKDFIIEPLSKSKDESS